jgi:hypothetical protein
LVTIGYHRLPMGYYRLLSVTRGDRRATER